ncbi:hypothetical protein ACN47E_002177 [Coniothyrium glycines]
MASNHVPSDQAPVQSHSIYTDPSYQNLFAADRYGSQPWDTQLHQQPGAPQNWHHGGGYGQQPYTAPTQAYSTQPHGLRTASPYQYGQFGQPGSMPNYGQISNVDPSLGVDHNALRQQQHSPYPMPAQSNPSQGHAGTVTPQALQHNAASQLQRPTASPFQNLKPTPDQYAQQRTTSQPFLQTVKPPQFEMPGVVRKGGFHVIDQAALIKATSSNALNKFVTLGADPFHLATNRTALPMYNARLSIRDLKKAGTDSKKLKAKLQASKSQMRALKSQEKSAAGFAGLRREVSDSASSDETSDDSSDYTSDEEEEESPLPASRPDDPHAAVRYDVIKSTWYPRASSPSSDKIKASMRELWEVLNTIQKRWRADSKAVTDAEEQKKIGELPVLKSRVASQRDLLQSALETAIQYAHPDVLYHLGQVKPFLYLCYQFLANRFHSKDYDGKLSAVIFEVLSQCGTVTSELLEETKVIKALSSMKKHANDKHKAVIQKTIEAAAANSKKAKVGSPPSADVAEGKGAKKVASDVATRPSGDGPLVKRPRAAEGSLGSIKKDAIPLVGNKSVTTATLQKRPGERPAAAPAPVKTRVNQVTNKPSGIFASLTAATKKPAVPAAGMPKANVPAKPATAAASKEKKTVATTATKPSFSFAQTMASLLKPKEQEVVPVKSEKQFPDETPEEKTKRLRKESRRHLRVAFRPDTSLVEIRYFEHEAQEDMGHEENLVRDAGDLGGEGRMFKQHKELDVDDDEDDDDVEAKPWSEPSQIDFTIVDAGERQRNYFPFGGGEIKPECPEKEANIRRENATLIVFYADAADIPTSPREPLDDDSPAAPVTYFGTPPEEVLKKCPQPPQATSAVDFTSLENMIKQFANPQTSQVPATSLPAPVQVPYVPPPPAGAPPVDLASILSALGQSTPQAAQPAPTPVQAPIQSQAPATFDITAFMANLQAQAASGATLPPPPPGLPPGFPPFPFQFPGQPQQQDAAAWQPQVQSQYDQQANGSTKRPRDEGNVNVDRGQGKRPKNRGERPHKVLACKFFQKGTCNKGDNCTYIHDLNM